MKIFKSNNSKHFLVGGFARATSGTIMYPVDLVKTRMQYSNRGEYRGSFDCLMKVVRKEGVLSLYSGLSVRLFYTIPSSAFSFFAYEFVKRNLQNFMVEENKTARGMKLVSISLLAGGGARLVGTLVRTPFELLKQRMQVKGMTGNSNMKTPVSLLKEMKFTRKDFLRGYGITLCRDAPFAALYFCFYEVMKGYLKRNLLVKQEQQQQVKGGRSSSFFLFSMIDTIHLFSGAFAGATATSLTIPMDVIKTRIQTNPEVYTGIVVTAKLTYGEGGWRSLMKGLGTRLIYLIPAASMTFAFYEKFKMMIGMEE